MQRLSALTSTLFCLILSAACTEREARGFSLPEGNPEAGLQAFKDHGCMSCHVVEGYEELREGIQPQMNLVLGGEVVETKTYGDLVTSVINPSHRISSAYRQSETTNEDGTSRMVSVNDELSVSELIDLIAFLEGQYTVAPYQPTTYPPYYYGR